jgi:pimeloyl-ACP methyl ester carboxylesterase
LVVAGDRDPIVPLVNARIMTRLIPNARLHVVRGGGHLFLLTHAGEVASVIGDFLQASGPASGEAPGA